ncbi:MAG: AzlD domain-containing protein [Geminicoccaceae bacterium]
MTATWAAVGVVGAATIAIKAAGTMLLRGRELPGRLGGMIELLGPVMLSALVVSNAFGGHGELVLDPRAAGLAAAAVPIYMRAPLLVIVATAAVTAALVRAV